MFPLALNADELRSYHRGLTQTRAVRVSVGLHDQDEDQIASLTQPAQMVEDGQVDVDTASEVTRQLSLAVIDTAGRLQLDPYGTYGVGLSPSRYVSVVRHDYIPDLARFVPCPLFFGGINRFNRSGSTVAIEALGKEAKAIPPATPWPGVHIEPREFVTTAIETILRRHGERKFRLPSLRHRRPDKPLDISKIGNGWETARQIAAAAGYSLRYDGEGFVVMRPRRNDLAFTLRLDEHLTAHPRVTYNFDELRNLIEVVGEQPSKGKRRPHAIADPPRDHPFSAYSPNMMRNGDPYFLVERIENSEIKRDREAQELADWTLGRRLLLAIEVEAECLPIPTAEESDVFAIEIVPGQFLQSPLDRFSIPLTVDGQMTLGYNFWKGLPPASRR